MSDKIRRTYHRFRDALVFALIVGLSVPVALVAQSTFPTDGFPGGGGGSFTGGTVANATTFEDTVQVDGVLSALGGIELSHATANTLSGSGGILSVEGVAQVGVSGTQTITGDKTFTGTTLFELGGGTGTVQPAGLLCKGAPDTTTATTDEESLFDCTVPANTLSADGAALFYGFTGYTAATANTKQIRVRIGPSATALTSRTAVLATGADAMNSDYFGSDPGCHVTRASASTARVYCLTRAGDDTLGGGSTFTFTNAHTVIEGTVSIDWTVENIMSFTADTNTAAAGFNLATVWVAVLQ